MASKFTRLIRFLPKGSSTPLYGDAILAPGITDPRHATHAHPFTSSPLHNPSATLLPPLPIDKLLSPLAPHDLATVRCLGLNYVQHAKESNLPLPTYPVLFYKPRTAITGPTAPIFVPPHAQIPGLDYEVELVVVIGKEGKNIPQEKVDEHIFGYTVGNDVSHREWQIKRGGGQWSSGKGCESWAPLGPCVVPPHALGEKMYTKVNGELRQDDRVQDMCFGVREAIAFLSRGVRLEVGDLLFMGTPSGVGMGKNPPVWLKDGDVVECGIDGIGSIENKVSYEAEEKATAKL